MSFELTKFVEDCCRALDAEKPQQIISDLVQSAIADPRAVMNTLGSPARAMLEKLHVSDTLTVLNVIWAPKMTLMPHNHSTWAVIGVYSGREDNIFWRRSKGGTNGKIEAAGAKSIAAGEIAALGKNIVHSVTNPTAQFTGAIHVYGGNFFELDRSEWDPMSLEEGAYDSAGVVALFEEENALLSQRLR